MTLTSGRGPLSPDPAGRFSAPVPVGVRYTEPYRRRVRAMIGDRTVVDSERVLLVHRPGWPPAYAFPADDVEVDGVSGDGEVDGGDGHGRLDRGAVEPDDAAPGYVRVAWTAVDAWYEEDERLPGPYPRNPYHRVDCVRTSRRLRVEVAGVDLVDTTRTVAVFETALEPKLYVHPDQVRRDLLIASPTRTWCNYKGTAWYWSAVIGDEVVEDVAWSYEDPLPEAGVLRRMLSFDEARVRVHTDLPAPAVPAEPADADLAGAEPADAVNRG